MNKEWSELNKTLQQQLKKKDSYEDGVSTLGLWVFFPISLVAHGDRRKDNRSL